MRPLDVFVSNLGLVKQIAQESSKPVKVIPLLPQYFPGLDPQAWPFLIPSICEGGGWAVYCNLPEVCCDVNALIPQARKAGIYAVFVHPQYGPDLMVFRNKFCVEFLSVADVRRMSVQDLRGFAWLPRDHVGRLAA